MKLDEDIWGPEPTEHELQMAKQIGELAVALDKAVRYAESFAKRQADIEEAKAVLLKYKSRFSYK